MQRQETCQAAINPDVRIFKNLNRAHSWPDCAEKRPNVLNEKLWLFECGEVAAVWHFRVVDEVETPFEDAALCAIDGFGDFVSTSFAVGRGCRMDIRGKVFFPHSIGLLYLAVTQFLGFMKYGDEYKVMGLAPYGEPVYLDAMHEIVRLLPKGRFELNLAYFNHYEDPVTYQFEGGKPVSPQNFSPKLEHLLGWPRRDPDEPLEKRHHNVARSMQAMYPSANPGSSMSRCPHALHVCLTAFRSNRVAQTGHRLTATSR